LPAIGANKDRDLSQRAEAIAGDLLAGDRRVILAWFILLIDIDHAKMHGLDEAFPDRDWGFSRCDDEFLSSLRGRHLGHVYGVRVGWGCFGGGFTPSPLTGPQVRALARCIARPFYTFQLALVKPD
jgi:hypothetical protein